MSDTELCYLSATEALSRFRNRSLSPRELLEALIRRAESIEPVINSFADRYFDEALTAAIKAERRYAKGSTFPSPFGGNSGCRQGRCQYQGQASNPRFAHL